MLRNQAFRMFLHLDSTHVEDVLIGDERLQRQEWERFGRDREAGQKEQPGIHDRKGTARRERPFDDDAAGAEQNGVDRR